MVLCKGIRFCPNHDLDKFEIYKDLQLIVRKLLLKSLYHKTNTNPAQSLQEDRALDQLISLLEESDTTDLIDRVNVSQLLNRVDEPSSEDNFLAKSKLKKKSDLCPAPSTNPNAAAFLRLINKDLEKLKIKTCKNMNLDTKEIEALEQLSSNNHITIKPANLYLTMKTTQLCVIRYTKTKNGTGGSHLRL